MVSKHRNKFAISDFHCNRAVIHHCFQIIHSNNFFLNMQVTSMCYVNQVLNTINIYALICTQTLDMCTYYILSFSKKQEFYGKIYEKIISCFLFENYAEILNGHGLKRELDI